MTMKATILSAAINMCEKHKRAVLTEEIRLAYNFKSKSLSNMLFSLAKEGLLKKTKQKNGRNAWASTKKGRDWLRKRSHEVWTMEEIAEIEAEIETGSAKTEQRVYTPTAMSAIEGISQLVDNNEQLIAGLRSLQSQINRLLMQFDKPPQAQIEAEPIQIETGK